MMREKFSDYLNILREGKRSDFVIIIVIVLLFTLIIGLNLHLVSDMISNKTEEVGEMQLENIRSELQETLTDAENATNRIALEIEQMMASGVTQEELRKYFENQSKEQQVIFKGACMNAYIAGKDYAIIPDFDMPENYHAQERLWYKGAIENPGKVFITEAYKDARTGDMCFTTSTALSDNETVVALDFNLNNTQKSIDQMTAEGDRIALIVNENGKIISYNDMSLAGENVNKKLPEFESVVEKVIQKKNHESFDVDLSTGKSKIFSSRTNNGWYMILSVGDFNLNRDNYQQMLIITLISGFMLAAIVIFYLIALKNKIQAENALGVKERFLAQLSHDLKEPLHRIMSLSNDIKNRQIRESAMQLNGMLDDLFTYSKLLATDNEEIQKSNTPKLSKTSRQVRIGIIAVLCVALTCSLIVSANNSINWGDTKMSREADIYDYQLSNWIAKHKSILSMFTSMISERPNIMDNYELAVKWLNDMAKNYPEISVCYLANPYREHQVIMNNGWEGPPGWKVDQRPWYIDCEKSADGFNISAPYYDDQTGLYCVTFSQVVYGQNGEFLGIFGIDFFLDKLIHILDESYTEDSYAFLVDKNGIIINHPSSDYQLSVDNLSNVSSTSYRHTYKNGKITTINDYNGKRASCLAKKNADSDFTVIVVNNWWNVYGDIVYLGALFAILFCIAVSAIILLINKLLNWQEEVNGRLKQSADAAMAAGQAKSQFLAQMSHEIRTPINAVIGMNEMILRESHEPSTLKYAQNVQIASESLLSIINDILDFSKIESGKMELIEENYRLDDLIKNLVNMIRDRAEKKNLEFKIIVNENIPNELFGDSVRIRQIVLNFLTNSVKYTKVGGIDFKIDYEPKSDEEIILKFHVKDTGIGIRDEDKKRLFKDFERFDNKQNKNIEGTGLGLAITYKLAKMMKGQVDVESTYKEGSTFSVMIPQKIMSNEKIGKFESTIKVTQEKYQVSFNAPDAKILVVDDNEMNLLVATSLLKATKIQVDTAISGMEALRKLALIKYDVIFLDQMMPSLDGIQTLKLAKEMKDNKSKNAPTIALTANAISGAREMFLKEGFTDYLSKPIDAQALEAMLLEYLPIEKICPPSEENEIKEEERSNNQENDFENLNVEVGLSYSADSVDMYKNILQMFCSLKADKQAKIEEAYNKEDWTNYTTFVHALKSTSLSIGGEKLNIAAKDLEMAGKTIISASTSELEKVEAIEFIKTHHAEAMELYDKLIEEGKEYLGENNNSELGMRNSESDNNSVKEEGNQKAKLQAAFDTEDWKTYAELIQADDTGEFKNLKMPAKMITSEFTNDQEKAEAIEYIKANHKKIVK